MKWAAQADHITPTFLKVVFNKWSILEYLDPYNHLPMKTDGA